MMKKRTALFLCFALMLSLLAGCSGGTTPPASDPAPAPSEQEPAAPAPEEQPAEADKPFAGTTIRVLTANQTCIEQVIHPNLDEFYDLTGITVEMEIMGNDDYANKAAIELAGKNKDLDIIFLRPLGDLKQYIQNGWLTDISRIGDDAEFDLDDYFAGSLESCTYDGVLYGIPIVAESQIMYYRKDLFEEKNLEVPKTLTELRQVAEALTDKSNDFYGFFMRGKSNALITQFSSILYSFGGRFNTATESLANTEEFKAATEFYGDILYNCAPPGVVNMTWTEGAALFAQGKLGIFMDSDAIFGNISGDANLAISEDQIGFSVIPAGTSGVSTPFYSTIGAWSIPAFSEKQEAALEFIKWAESKEMGVRMAVESRNAGCRSSVWEDDEAMATFAPEMLQAMIDSRNIAIGGDRPTVINVGEARDILSVPIQAAILGEDPTAELADAHEKFQALIDKENQ